MRRPIKVLFVCVHNAARSQMAEAYLNLLGKGMFQAESAGLEPTELNPLAVKVMQEEKLDIAGNLAKSVFDFFRQGRIYNFVITVCDESNSERCPIFPGRVTRLHWSFTDPASLTGSPSEKMDQTRIIRDQIKARIKDFIEQTTRELF